MMSRGGWRKALSGVVATAALLALGSAAITPASASPSDPADPGFYLWGQDWALTGASISLARYGARTCDASDLVYFRDADGSTLLETSGRGFPEWGDVRFLSLPPGVTGEGEIVVACGSPESNTEVAAFPYTIRATAPSSVYRTPGMFTDFTRGGSTVYVLNKMGFTPGESVRVTLYDQSMSHLSGPFSNATAVPVTVTADGAGAITATIPVPSSFSGDDYSSLISAATSHTIFDTDSGGESLPGTPTLTVAATAAAGGIATVSGTGYAAGETVVVALHSATAEPVVLGNVVATSGRAISGSFTIPSGTVPGSYRIWAGSKTGSYLLQNAPLTVTAAATLVNSAKPAITGTLKVGNVLTATKGTWAAVPAPLPVYTYSWWRDGSAIDGATAATYTLTPDDLAATITVRVQAAKAGYATTNVESNATAAIGTGVLAPAPVPTVTGTAKVGATLTAVPGTWAASSTLSYQWFAGTTPIVDATTATLLLTADTFGKKITVAVTGTKPGLTATKTSLPTAAVAAIPFEETVAPVVSGTPQVGVPLTADPGTWTPAATFSYQWLAAGVPIAGATQSTFTPKGAQLGKLITVKVTGTAVGAIAAARVVTPATAVALGAYAATPEPTVTGSARVGATLTASTAGWDAGSTFTYRWFADSVPIAGATAATYVPTATQVGEDITVRVTSTTAGYPVVVRTSSVGSGPLERGAFATAPVPTIAKTPAAASLRFGNTLTAVPGAWSPGATFSYQWYANGVEIIGAEAATYKPTAAQVGATFSVRVIGSKSGFASTARTSAETAPLEALAFTTTPVAASVTGTGKVGTKLTAVVGTFTPAPSLVYQWFSDGTSIDGATASTFTVTSAQLGTTVTVVISGSLPGYTPVAKFPAGKLVVP